MLEASRHAQPASGDRSTDCGASRSTRRASVARRSGGAASASRRSRGARARELQRRLRRREHPRLRGRRLVPDVRAGSPSGGPASGSSCASTPPRIAGTAWVNDTQVAEHEGGYTPFEADVTDVVELGRREPDHRGRRQPPDAGRRSRPGASRRRPTGRASRTSTTSSTTPACIARSGSTRPRASHVDDITVVTELDGSTGTVALPTIEAAGERAPRSASTLRDAEGSGGRDARRELRRAHASRTSIRGVRARATCTSSTVELVGRRRRRSTSTRCRSAIRTVRVDGHALPDQRRAVLLHRLRQARGQPGPRQGPRRRVHGARLRAAGLARRELLPHVALSLRGGVCSSTPTGTASSSSTRRRRSGSTAGSPAASSAPSRSRPSRPTRSDPRTQEAHRQAIRELIARDKNHPCVVLWTIANEPESVTPEARALLRAAGGGDAAARSVTARSRSPT